MEDKININQIPAHNNESQEFEFKYNFINTPWDNRTKKSKVGIVVLLITIFTATMSCVANSFAMHYRGYYSSSKNINNSKNNCFRVKTEEYRFVARIHSASSKELLCVGAVVSPTSILANGVCVKSGPIRVYTGSPTDPYCKKGFSVDNIEPVSRDASQKLVLLSSFENMNKCTHIVRIGTSLDWKMKAVIIGRPLSIGRTLSRQSVTLNGKNVLSGGTKILKKIVKDNTICVKALARCPVRVGDLLMQNGELYGLATTSSSDRNRRACFDDLDAVRSQLNELDAEIKA